MKKFLIILIPLILIGCSNTITPQSKLSEMLQGTHELRKFKDTTHLESKMSGSYFIFMGSINQKSDIKREVTFSFKNPGGEYINMSLPLDKVRVKIDNTVKIPYVKFKWKPYYSSNDIETIQNYQIIYVVIYCKDEDYTYNINLNEESK